MKALKCDICEKLEEGIGNRIVVYRRELDICSDCTAKIDAVIKAQTKIKKSK